MINFVAAIGENGEMGYRDGLPWPFHSTKADLRRYQSLVKDQVVAVGSRTYFEYKNARKSLGTDRILVVSSTNKELPGVAIASIEDIKKRAKKEDVWVLGGAKIFEQLVPVADNMYLTRIHSRFEADTFFPKFDVNVWETLQKEDYPADSENLYPYTFLKLSRNKNKNE